MIEFKNPEEREEATNLFCRLVHLHAINESTFVMGMINSLCKNIFGDDFKIEMLPGLKSIDESNFIHPEERKWKYMDE